MLGSLSKSHRMGTERAHFHARRHTLDFVDWGCLAARNSVGILRRSHLPDSILHQRCRAHNHQKPQATLQ